MSDITEGIGGAIEGALSGRAVEPAHGSASSGDTEGGACLNCGAEPQGNFCQNCGQKRHVHRTLAAIGHDLLHGVLHLDGKFWSTIPLLVFKPGKLTRRYIDGERAKFVSPMAMFLFSIFTMFAAFQVAGITVPGDLGGSRAIANGMETAQEEIAAKVTDLEEQLAAIPADDPEKATLEKQLVDARAALDGIKTGVKFTGAMANDPEFNVTGIEALDEGILKKWQENPGLMLYKLQANAYKFSWLLIPISIPFVWLMFAWKRRFKAYDHAIFVTYSIAFMSLLFIALSLLTATDLAAVGCSLRWSLLRPSMCINSCATLMIWAGLARTGD